MPVLALKKGSQQLLLLYTWSLSEKPIFSSVKNILNTEEVLHRLDVTQNREEDSLNILLFCLLK